MPSRRSTLALGLVSTISLGVPFLLIAVAQQAMPTATMAAIRVGLAAATLVLLLACRRKAERARARQAVSRHVGPLIIVALAAAVLPNLLIGAAERHLPSGIVAVLLATTPLWTALGEAATASGEHLAARQWAAIPLALVGVGVASGASIRPDELGWCLLPAAAAISYATANLVLRRRLAGVPALAVAAAEMAFASVALLPLALLEAGRVQWWPPAIAALLVAGVGCSGLGWLANTALVQRVGAGRASVVSYTSVLLSVALGVLVLNEPLTARLAAGTVVLVVAVALFAAPARPPRKDHPVIELCVLGFLAEAPLHAYALRRRITALIGHVKPLSDGALTPALRRLAARGLVVAHTEPSGRGPRRHVYALTDAGQAELQRRLAEPSATDVTDRSRYFAVLAFLHQLDDPAQRRAVLTRRLEFLEEESRGFFLPEQEQLPAQRSLFRDGMNQMATEIWNAERAWLQRTLASASV